MRRAIYFTWDICSSTIFSNSSSVRWCLGASTVMESMVSISNSRLSPEAKTPDGTRQGKQSSVVRGGGNEEERGLLVALFCSAEAVARGR